ncbi:MAG: threonine/serine ThrE exporter family protein [Flavisolibacter sp.]
MSSEGRKLNEVGSLLLEIGNLLMCSGASTARVRMTINRISGALGYSTDMFITHRALMLTISDSAQEEFLSSLKRVAPHGANFKVISGISRMSWKIVDEHWELKKIREEVKRLSGLPHYPRFVVLLVVGLAGASFCRLFGGNYIEMLVTFAASFVGLFVRQEASVRHFNQYLCVFFASFAASFVAGSFQKFGISTELEHAFATSVLFLVPGIPLINTFSDIIDGNILNGLIRGVHGLTVAVAISLGMLTTILIYHFQ